MKSQKLERRGNVIQFPVPVHRSWWEIGDDYLLGANSALWQGCLLEIEWPGYKPGGLHGIELNNGRHVMRYITRTVRARGEPAMEVHGGDAAKRWLLPLRFVRRTGLVLRAFWTEQTADGKPQAHEFDYSASVVMAKRVH